MREYYEILSIVSNDYQFSTRNPDSIKTKESAINLTKQNKTRNSLRNDEESKETTKLQMLHKKTKSFV